MRMQSLRSWFGLFLACIVLFANVSFSETEKLTPFQVNYNLPAVSAVLVEDGRTVFAELRGDADIEGELDLRDTVELRLGSTAGLMTEIALAEALRDHRIEVGTEIGPYLPAALADRKDLAKLTFEHLLLHSSGIPTTTYRTVSTEPIRAPFRSEAESFVASYRLRPLFEPGAYSMISNVNRVLSGLVLEEIVGMPYEEYLEQFYSRLGMHRTASRMTTPGVSEQAVAYDFLRGEHRPSRAFFPRLTAADALISTTEDIERFLHRATGERLAAWEALGVLERRFGNNRLAFGRSYGFQVMDYHGEEAFVYDAKIPGAESRILLIPRLKLGLFVYYNTNSAEAMSKITDNLLAAYMGGRGSVQKKDYVKVGNLSKLAAYYSPINNSKETPEKLAGVLEQINISKIDGGLLIGRDFYKPLSETFFYCEPLDRLAEFRTDAEGRLQYLILGDRMYRRTFALQSSTLLGTLFVVLILVVALNALLLFRKWKDLYHERVDAGPRRILLFHSVLMILLWLCCWFGLRATDGWTWAYGPGMLWTILRFGGWLIPLSAGMLILAQIRTREDYQWRGFLTLVIRANIVLSLLFFFGLFQYHLVWRW